MEGFGLLIGHLLGDYWPFQNDWLAKNKSNPLQGSFPDLRFSKEESAEGTYRRYDEAVFAWQKAKKAFAVGHLACTIHCLFYTLSVWLFSCWWMPWWGLLVCFISHWPIDRFRLARWVMLRSGQKDFATGILSPWSVIVVDNTWHLLTLFLIGILAR